MFVLDNLMRKNPNITFRHDDPSLAEAIFDRLELFTPQTDELSSHSLYFIDSSASVADMEAAPDLHRSNRIITVFARVCTPQYRYLKKLHEENDQLRLISVSSPLDDTNLFLALIKTAYDLVVQQFDDYISINGQFMILAMRGQSDAVEQTIEYFKETIGNPIAIYNDTFECIATTDEYLRHPTIISNGRRHTRLSNLYFTDQVIAIKRDGKFVEYPVLSFPIRFQNTVRAYLSVIEVERKITDADYIIMESAASAILTEIKHELAIQNIETRNRGRFLYDLFYAKEVDDNAVQEQARSYNIDLSRPFRVLVFGNVVGTPKNVKPRPIKNVLNPTVQDDLLSIVLKNSRQLANSTVVGYVNNTLVCLVLGENEEDMSSEFVESLCENIRKDVNDYFTNPGLHIGVSELGVRRSDLRVQYLRAVSTLRYIDITAPKQSYRLGFYEDNVVLNSVSVINDRQMIELLIPRAIHEIDAYDKAQNTNLLETLSVYFDSDCNAKEAASRLFIHHKTMFYRLNKIMEHFGLDLTDSDTKMQLYFGLKLYYAMQIDSFNG